MWIGSVSEFGIRTCEIKRKWISPASELQVMQLWKSSSIRARCWVLLLSELVFSSPAFKTSSPPQKSDPPSTAQLIIGSRDGNLRDILHSTNLWWKRQNLLANSGCLYPCSWATMVEAMPEHLANFSMFSIFRASSKMHMIQKNLKHVFMYGKKKHGKTSMTPRLCWPRPVGFDLQSLQLGYTTALLPPGSLT